MSPAVMPFVDATDEELLTAIGGPDQADAFHEFMDRFERRIYAICLRFFGNETDAEDSAQQALLTILRRASTFRGDSQASTWVYRVTTNACHDAARKAARRPSTSVDDIVEIADAAGLTASDDLEGREMAEEVQRALATLDDVTRSLVILVSIEGLSYEEAAASTDLPIGTVKSRIHRARAKLAVLLGTSGTPAASKEEQRN